MLGKLATNTKTLQPDWIHLYHTTRTHIRIFMSGTIQVNPIKVKNAGWFGLWSSLTHRARMRAQILQLWDD